MFTCPVLVALFTASASGSAATCFCILPSLLFITQNSRARVWYHASRPQFCRSLHTSLTLGMQVSLQRKGSTQMALHCPLAGCLQKLACFLNCFLNSSAHCWPLCTCLVHIGLAALYSFLWHLICLFQHLCIRHMLPYLAVPIRSAACVVLIGHGHQHLHLLAV